uniref:DELTA-sagatoxin-Srs1a-like n=1 Tax=Monopterus albus TaxID=43700 RepID=UPI0009B472E5|nr:DELTA-sagatoxin-Srs1a-like [Monopterus albus]
MLLIKIQNECSDYVLCNPRVYTYSGNYNKPLPATIGPSKSGGALFTKTPNTACGSVGVFTYDLQNKSTKRCSRKVAVMFSNPYDFNLYSNWFAVGVFNKNKKCDYDLYSEMYYNEEKGFVRGEARNHALTYTSDVVNIIATMSDSYKPVIKVQLCNK